MGWKLEIFLNNYIDAISTQIQWRIYIYRNFDLDTNIKIQSKFA